MQKWNGKINKELEHKRKEPHRNSGAKEYNDWTEEFKKDFPQGTEQAEERINELEDRSIEIMQGEGQREK